MTISWNDVKLLFRGIDIAMMRSPYVNQSARLDLDSYLAVKDNINSIYGIVTDPNPRAVMPKPPFAPWSQDKVSALGKWSGIDPGQDPPPFLKTDPAKVEKSRQFVAVSQFLTGFDDLHEDAELAVKYLDRLRARATDAPEPEDETQYRGEDLEELIRRFDPGQIEDFEKNVLTQEKYARIAKVIILLWYTGAFIRGGFAIDSGTPEDNQYIQGLAWRAVQAHPMGYSREGEASYWAEKPQEDGTYTGLGRLRE